MRKKAYLRSEKIQEYLLRKNKSQNWLAKRLQITSGYMSELVNGKKCASPVVREKLIKHLAISDFDDLFEIK